MRVKKKYPHCDVKSPVIGSSNEHNVCLKVPGNSKNQPLGLITVIEREYKVKYQRLREF